MIFAAHQPHYLPWLRYLHKIAAADAFVLLDDAQYTKNGWQNRTRIKGPQGPVLLTVPVHARLGATIRETRPALDGWPRRHLAALDTSYGRHLGPLRAQLASAICEAFGTSLATLNLATLRVLLHAFGITTPVVLSSELRVSGTASERLARIGRALGADAYLTGAFALDAYLDPMPFMASGIEIVVQDWRCPRYAQRFPSAGFVADLSAIDLTIAQKDQRLGVLMSGGGVISAASRNSDRTESVLSGAAGTPAGPMGGAAA